MEMDSELKAQWLVALRSGEYEQGYGRLGDVNHRTGGREYCCLGVLCDIAKERLALAGISVSWSDEIMFVDCNTNYLNGDVCSALGLPSHFWRLTGLPNMRDGNSPSLDKFNDGGLTFKQIADVIEREL